MAFPCEKSRTAGQMSKTCLQTGLCNLLLLVAFILLMTMKLLKLRAFTSGLNFKNSPSNPNCITKQIYYVQVRKIKTF